VLTSEVIAALRKQLERHGDREVDVVFDAGFASMGVEFVGRDKDDDPIICIDDPSWQRRGHPDDVQAGLTEEKR
jgi:hypothetical protein